MPLQEKGVAYLTRRLQEGNGGLLFMEMRLGKTKTLIRFLVSQNVPGPFLIICPNSVKATWVTELREEGETSIALLEGGRDSKESLLSGDHKWYVVNYESAVPISEKRKGLDLHLYKWGAVVCDESIRLANPKSRTTKYFVKWFKHIPLKYVLCGNPTPESELQYLTQFLFVQKNFLGFDSYWKFRDQTCTQLGFEWLPTNETKERIYKYVHDQAFIATRAQAGIGSKKLYSIRTVTLSTKQREAYDAMKKTFEYNGVTTKYLISQLIHLAKIAGGYDIATGQWFSDAKVKEILSLLKGELKGQQLLIWCRFRHEQDYIVSRLQEAGYRVGVVNGDVEPKEREEIRAAFNLGLYKVVVATITSMKAGTNWADRCDTVIYYSNEYSLDARSQSEDRIVHPKKKSPILIIDLVTAETVDEEVIKLLRDKKLNSHLFMSALFKNLFAKYENIGNDRSGPWVRDRLLGLRAVQSG